MAASTRRRMAHRTRRQDAGDGGMPDPLTWGPCPGDHGRFECGTLIVPVDYDDPDGPTMSIALTRWPAMSESERLDLRPRATRLRLVRRHASLRVRRERDRAPIRGELLEDLLADYFRATGDVVSATDGRIIVL
jgi:hypothetical protein